MCKKKKKNHTIIESKKDYNFQDAMLSPKNGLFAAVSEH